MQRELMAVFAGGVVQGTVLVAFPAVATILTSPSVFGFSSAQYGIVFAPQFACAIVAAFAGAALTRRIGMKRVFVFGFAADVLSMVLFFASRYALGDRGLSYAIVLAATACLGIAFGLTVPTLNALAAAGSPRDPDRAVLVLNALLGIGTVLAPVLAAIFVGAGIWWALPLLAAAMAAALLLFSALLPLVAAAAPASAAAPAGSRRRLALYLAVAFLYGIVETTNGNWGELEISRTFAATAGLAPFALIAFWASVTAGRAVFGSFERRLAPRNVYRALPFAAALALAAIAFTAQANVAAGVALFALAGIGCSALLPLTISFAQREFAASASGIGGTLIAVYQIGNSVAVFAVGPLLTAKLATLSTVFGAAAIAAIVLGVGSFLVVKHPAVAAAD